MKCQNCNAEVKFLYSLFDKKYCLDCFDKVRKELYQKDLKENTEKYLLKWGFPERFISFEKEDLFRDYKEIFDDLLNILHRHGLYLYGSVGSGKTCMATLLAKEYIKNTYEDFHFINTTDFLLQLKKTFQENENYNDYDLIMKYAKKENLVIDDLGAEKISEYAKQSIYLVINYRYQHNLKTIITSNLSLSEISNLYDDRIASRINEMCKVVNLLEIDLRNK